MLLLAIKGPGRKDTMNDSVDIQAQEVSKQVQSYDQHGGVTLGPYASHIWRSDPKHLAFLLARYLFAAKMMHGRARALEVGCGDATGTPIVLQEVSSVTAVDMEAAIIADAQDRYADDLRLNFEVRDIVADPPCQKYDAVYAIDVLEHIPPANSSAFFRAMAMSCKESALLIVGTPNATAARYASPVSAKTHVNLHDATTLRMQMLVHCESVMMFGQNDTTMHCGYFDMAHYLWAVGSGVGGKG